MKPQNHKSILSLLTGVLILALLMIGCDNGGKSADESGKSVPPAPSVKETQPSGGDDNSFSLNQYQNTISDGTYENLYVTPNPSDGTSCITTDVPSGNNSWTDSNCPQNLGSLSNPLKVSVYSDSGNNTLLSYAKIWVVTEIMVSEGDTTTTNTAYAQNFKTDGKETGAQLKYVIPSDKSTVRISYSTGGTGIVVIGSMDGGDEF